MELLQASDRPPEGLARGRWQAPAWVIAVLAAAVAVAAIAFVIGRARRAGRAQSRSGATKR